MKARFVSERVREDLEEVEDYTGVPMSDDAWSAMASLTRIQRIDVFKYIRECLKFAKEKNDED